MKPKVEKVAGFARSLHRANIVTAAMMEGLPVPGLAEIERLWSGSGRERARWIAVSMRVMTRSPEFFAPEPIRKARRGLEGWIDRATSILMLIALAILSAAAGMIAAEWGWGFWERLAGRF